MSVVRLALADAEARAAFAAEQDVEYARQKVRAGQWPPEEALARAHEANAGLRAGAGLVWRARDETGSHVGWAWADAPPFEDEPHRAFLFQITVDEPRRGRGFGRALLAGIEDELRARGWRALRLNVFRWNDAAIALYRSAGYVPIEESDVSIHFAKPL